LRAVLEADDDLARRRAGEPALEARLEAELADLRPGTVRRAEALELLGRRRPHRAENRAGEAARRREGRRGVEGLQAGDGLERGLPVLEVGLAQRHRLDELLRPSTADRPRVRAGVDVHDL